MEGLVHWQFKFCPCKGWEGFKQKTGTIKFVILKNFSLKIPLLRKVWGVRRQRDQSKFYCLNPDEVTMAWCVWRR